ncbi:MAG: DeoR/GlpR family DNA-binding transcription regulator [Candidatus Merdivicinus sp.]
MSGYIRQKEILSLLEQKAEVRVEEFCHALYVSAPTIRRDLQALEREGLIRRTRGGAALLRGAGTESPFTLRSSEHHGAKEQMAEEAVTLISDGMTLFLDSSSTILRLAALLGRFQDLTVITNGIRTVELLSDFPQLTVFSTGGRVRPHSKSLIGTSACDMIRQHCADLVFFSSQGVSEAFGPTEANEEEAQIKKCFLKSAKKAVFLADESKWGMDYCARICRLEAIFRIFRR